MGSSSFRAAAVAAAFTAVAAAQHQSPQHVSFGVYSFKKPTEVYKEFHPAIEAIERAAAVELQRPVHIDVRVYKTYQECLDAFVVGEVDFVRFGPSSYVLAKQREPDVKLLAAEQEDGKKVCKGVIVVQRDSPIQTLADLRGKRFAFGDEQSTIGRFLSQAELLNAGIRGEDLASFRYLDRHDLVYAAVQLGDFDAGALHGGIFERLNDKRDRALRVIHTFDNVGKPWIASAQLAPAIRSALRNSLLSMADPEALKALQVSGFLPATDKDYEPVRRGMQQSAKFAPKAAPVDPAAPPKGK